MGQTKKKMKNRELVKTRGRVKQTQKLNEALHHNFLTSQSSYGMR